MCEKRLAEKAARHWSKLPRKVVVSGCGTWGWGLGVIRMLLDSLILKVSSSCDGSVNLCEILCCALRGK